MMRVTVSDLRHKDVVNIKDGARLGCVCDVELDLSCAKVLALIIYGRPRWFGLFGREDDIFIGLDNIKVVGEDTILVSFECPARPRGRKKFNMFEN